MKTVSFHKAISSVFIVCFTAFALVCLLPLHTSAKAPDAVSYLQSLAAATGNEVHTVSAKGIPGSYSTISEACDIADEGDIILVYPGVYDESIDIRSKSLLILGVDKAACVIQFNTCNYSTPVLNVSSGLIANFTIYGYKDGKAGKNALPEFASDHTLADAEVISKPDDYFKGYAIHIDDDHEEGRFLTFSNCDIISENSHVVGVGLRDHFNLTFDNCYMKASDEGCIFFVHDPDVFEKGGTDMHISFVNNVWENLGTPYMMLLTSINVANHVDLRFINVTSYCYSTNYNALYLPGNLYNGTDIRMQALNPELTETPIYTEFDVFTKRLKELREDFPYDQPGIHYIYDDGFPITENDTNTVSLFYVHNPLNIPGNAWIGTHIYHLTPDSFGNTIDDMNYRPAE